MNAELGQIRARSSTQPSHGLRGKLERIECAIRLGAPGDIGWHRFDGGGGWNGLGGPFVLVVLQRTKHAFAIESNRDDRFDIAVTGGRSVVRDRGEATRDRGFDSCTGGGCGCDGRARDGIDIDHLGNHARGFERRIGWRGQGRGCIGEWYARRFGGGALIDARVWVGAVA